MVLVGSDTNEYISYDEFLRIQLKIGKVIHAEAIQGMQRVFKAIVDLGGERRELAVGGASHYSPEQFVGRLVVVCTNLEPRKIGGMISNGMLLAAEGPDGRPTFLTVEDNTSIGSIVR